MNYKVPLKNPSPDITNAIKIIMGESPIKNHPPLVEYLIDPVHMKRIIEMIGENWSDERTKSLDNYIECWYRLGYDYVRIERDAGFATGGKEVADTTVKERTRKWVTMKSGIINTWDDFERYPWPEKEDIDRVLEDIMYINNHLPEGMGLIASHGGGIYERLSQIMGYGNLCVSLYENPELVEAVTKKIGTIMENFYNKLVQFEHLVAVWPGDDMGYKTATLISPHHLRKYVLPWHKRFAHIAHQAGKPYFLHSCGNVLEIMNDLIEDIGMDAKHSFEDGIISIIEFQKIYGKRIGVLGGVDVDVLAHQDEDGVRRYTRKIIEECAPCGRFAVGSGNSIPTYIPLENYFAMLDETLK